jgi:hypothetical protein
VEAKLSAFEYKCGSISKRSGKISISLDTEQDLGLRYAAKTEKVSLFHQPQITQMNTDLNEERQALLFILICVYLSQSAAEMLPRSSEGFGRQGLMCTSFLWECFYALRVNNHATSHERSATGNQNSPHITAN